MPLDVLAHTVCDLVPGQGRPGPGWYLHAANERVEAGPFPSIGAAVRAILWLSEQSRGVHPAPWTAHYHPQGVLIGSRVHRSPLLLAC